MRQLAQVVSKLSIKVLEGEAKSKKETKLAKTKEKPVEEDPETSSDEDSEEEEAPPTKRKQQVKMISQKKIYQKEIENLKKQIEKQNSGSSKVIAHSALEHPPSRSARRVCRQLEKMQARM